MYKAKPISPTLLRLLASADLVLQSLESGDLFFDAGAPLERTIAAFEALTAAVDAARRDIPKLSCQASPFARHRSLVLSNGFTGEFFRSLVRSLYYQHGEVTLHPLHARIPKEHHEAALEMVCEYARNGAAAPHLETLIREIEFIDRMEAA
ncbi:MAG: hypothetical protein FWD77_06305 [Betaproteobacteria bacterium]|nr:hypothetical protein [Betaproteobacteria bacterium]